MRLILFLCVLPVVLSFVPTAEEEEFVDKILAFYGNFQSPDIVLSDEAKDAAREIAITAMNISVPIRDREKILVKKLLSFLPESNEAEAAEKIMVVIAHQIMSVVKLIDPYITKENLEYIHMAIELALDDDFRKGTNKERKRMMWRLIGRIEEDILKKESNVYLKKEDIHVFHAFNM